MMEKTPRQDFTTNIFLDSKPSGRGAQELLQKAKDLLSESGKVLNIFTRTPQEWYCALRTAKRVGLSEQDILDKIKERQFARQGKQWDVADRIRKELAERSIILEDKDGRTDWKIKVG